jgi:thymidylate synthase
MTQQYLDHSKRILSSEYTHFKGGSKDVSLISLFGHQNEYDLRTGRDQFPLLTTKKMATPSIIHELIWFLRGDENIKYLVENEVPIWNKDVFQHNLPGMVEAGIFPKESLDFKRNSPEWNQLEEEYMKKMKSESGFIDQWGNAGPIYGPQWRTWGRFEDAGVDITVGDKVYRAYIKNPSQGIDQINGLIKKLKKNPQGKKHIVSAWNVGDLPDMSLPPCHVLFQVNANEGQMDLQLYQRSCDQFLGVPFNIASYVMMNHIIANALDFEPRRFIHTFGDAHFYAGKNERGNWYHENREEFQRRIRDAISVENETGEKFKYKEVLEWVKSSVPPEREGEKLFDHVTAILEQLGNEPQPPPTLRVVHKDINDLTIDDFKVEGYKTPYRFIKREMAS